MTEAAEKPVAAAGPRKAASAFIFVTVTLDALGLGIIIPVLPKLVLEFSGGETARAAEIFGIFGIAWALMQFVFSPALGVLSDAWGRRPVILLSNLGLGLDYILMALAPTLGLLFVGRIISGITTASISTAGAYIADVTPPERRAAGFGMINAAFGLGFVLGPAVGGLLGGFDPRLPFWVAAGFSLTNAAYGFFVLPESLPPEKRTPFVWRRANPFGGFALLRSNPQILRLAAVVFLYFLAHEVLPSVFVLYTSYRYGWDESAIGLCLAATGVCGFLVQAGLVQPFVRRFGERRAMLAGLAFGVAGLGIFGLATTGEGFLIGVLVLSIWGLFNPAAQGLMSGRIGASEQGRLQGTVSGLRGLAGLLGPGLFTFTFARFIDADGLHAPGAPFLLAAVLLVAAAILVRTRI